MELISAQLALNWNAKRTHGKVGAGGKEKTRDKRPVSCRAWYCGRGGCLDLAREEAMGNGSRAGVGES